MSKLMHDTIAVFHGQGQPLHAVEPAQVALLMRRNGAVLFRGYAVGLDDFRAFSDRFSSRFIGYPHAKLRNMVDASSNIQTVVVNNAPIPLHSELSYTPFQPNIGWLYCIEFEGTGGETILCDGLKVARALPEPLRRTLETSMLDCGCTWTSEQMRSILSAGPDDNLDELIRQAGLTTYLTRKGNSYTQTFEAPFLVRHQGSGELVFANNIIHNSRTPFWMVVWRMLHIPVDPLRVSQWLPLPGRQPGAGDVRFPKWKSGRPISRHLVRQFMEITRRLEVEVAWRTGDVLLWDNTRVLHARRGWSGKRTILTRWGADFTVPLPTYLAVPIQPF